MTIVTITSNATNSGFINFDLPIDGSTLLSTLLVSVIVAIVAAYATNRISQYFSFRNGKHGLVREMKRNYDRSDTLLWAVNKTKLECVDKYKRDEVAALQKINFVNGSFNYFSQSGYLNKMPNNFIKDVEDLYLASEIISSLYNWDIKYQWQLQQHTTSIGQRNRLMSNRLDNLSRFEKEMNRYRGIYSKLIREHPWIQRYIKNSQYF